MNPPATPIDVIALRATDRSPDGKVITLSLKTRYSTERAYSVPVECLYELTADLQKLNSAAGAAPVAPPTAAPQPAEQAPNRVSVTVPKKWAVTSGLPHHPVVVMIFDAQTDKQAGYGLNATAAKQMAAGLVKCADAVAEHEAAKRKLS